MPANQLTPSNLYSETCALGCETVHGIDVEVTFGFIRIVLPSGDMNKSSPAKFKHKFECRIAKTKIKFLFVSNQARRYINLV